MFSLFMYICLSLLLSFEEIIKKDDGYLNFSGIIRNNETNYHFFQIWCNFIKILS